MTVFSLTQNIGLIVTLCVIYRLASHRLDRYTLGGRLGLGATFGVVAVLSMMNAWQLRPGIAFDARSIVVSLAGVFGGFVTAAVAAIIAALYRLYLGGDGGLTGTASILSAGFFGYLFHRLAARRPQRLRPLNLYLFGLVVHLVLLAWLFGLPGGGGFAVLREVFLPVMVMLPLGTMLVGWLLADQDARSTQEREQKSEIARLDRLYTSLSRINQTILGGDEREVVLPAICRVLAEQAGIRFVAIYEFDQQKDRPQLVAKAGEGPDLPHSFRGGASFPIRMEGRVWASLDVFTSEIDGFLDKEVGLLNEVADEIGYALRAWQKDVERRKAAAALAESEQRYRYLFEHNPHPMWVCHRETLAFLDVNESAVRFYGYTRAEFLSMNFMDLHDPESIPLPMETTLDGAEEMRHRGILRQSRKDGSVIEAEVTWTNLEFGNQPAQLVLAIDVSERQQSAEKIQRLNRVRAVLSNIRQSIVRTRDERSLYHEACRIAVDEGKFQAAWIGMTDEASGEVKVVASAGGIEGYLEGTSINVKSGHVFGPVATAIREDRPVICNDVEHDSPFPHWRAAALARGFRSIAAVPLKRNGKILGAFAQYAEVADFFDQDEIELLKELATDISFAIEFLEQEALRKHAEQARAESEARFSSAFQFAATGMALVAPDGCWLKVNGALCSLLGYSEDELLARTFQEITHPDDLAGDLEQVREILAGEIRTYQLEKRYLHKSGKPVWGLLSTSLVRDHAGRPVQFISQVQDITEQKRATEAVRASEERYRKLAEVLRTNNQRLLLTQAIGQIGSWERDLESSTLWVSEGYFRLFGMSYSAQDVPSEIVREMISCLPESDRLRLYKGLDELLDGAPYSQEYTIHPADGGASRVVKTVAEVLRDGTGKPLKIIGVTQDVTTRRHAEDSLRMSEQEQREIARQLQEERTRLVQAQAVANVGSWETELPSLNVTWSEQTHRIFETDPAHFRPTHADFLRLVHADDRERVSSAFQASLGRRGPSAVEHRLLMADGRIKSVEERWQVFYEKGQAVRVVGTCLDITERVRAEEEIRAAGQRLTYHVENSPLAVIEWDGYVRIQRWSQRAESLFGWSAEETIGLSAVDLGFVHPEDRTEVSKVFNRLLNGDDRRNLCINRNIAKDGQILHCEWYNSAMVGKDGRLLSILSLVHDITERRQAEDSVLQFQQQLRALSARVETLREEDRTRIAREIHDELGQLLTGIKMDLRWVENRLDSLGDDLRLNPILDKLLAANELTDATVKTVQRIAADLRPGILDKLGLLTALQYEGSRFEERSQIPCHVSVPSLSPHLRPEAATAFFRIFQEALTNIVRHASATTVEVEFGVHNGTHRLEIRDDGKGIKTLDLTKPGSLGLLGMQERARLLGGDVRFVSRATGGTAVLIEIPGSPVAEETP